jgi:hypothetical protein
MYAHSSIILRYAGIGQSQANSHANVMFSDDILMNFPPNGRRRRPLGIISTVFAADSISLVPTLERNPLFWLTSSAISWRNSFPENRLHYTSASGAQNTRYDADRRNKRKKTTKSRHKPLYDKRMRRFQ